LIHPPYGYAVERITVIIGNVTGYNDVVFVVVLLCAGKEAQQADANA
jgi:hypothetical protein